MRMLMCAHALVCHVRVYICVGYIYNDAMVYAHFVCARAHLCVVRVCIYIYLKNILT
jgi:hypothetical protein